MTTAIANREKVEQFTELARIAVQKFSAVVSFAPERIIQLGVLALYRNPLLLECARETMVARLIDAAQLGLDPTGLGGEAYLVPFWNSKKERREAQLIIGYQGLQKLVEQTGKAYVENAQVVYEGDVFEYEFGTQTHIKHVPSGDPEKQIPEKITHAYMTAVRLSNPIRPVFEVMTRKEIEAIRKRSRAGESGPWITDYAEMCKKTVVRRGQKDLPKSVELVKAIEIDARADTGEELPLSETDLALQEEVAPNSKSKAVAEKLAKPDSVNGEPNPEPPPAKKGSLI